MSVQLPQAIAHLLRQVVEAHPDVAAWVAGKVSTAHAIVLQRINAIGVGYAHIPPGRLRGSGIDPQRLPPALLQVVADILGQAGEILSVCILDLLPLFSSQPL